MGPFILAFTISWLLIFAYIFVLLKARARLNKKLM
ncbi:MAG: CcmD family protein [Methanosarcinaceae archaeon]|nr:CcmD family protein [Methanosarcinaceae archaeon]